MRREKVDKHYTLFKLLRLSSKLWTQQILVLISGSLGDLLIAIYSFEEIGIMSVTKVLVDLDSREGIPRHITIS